MKTAYCAVACFVVTMGTFAAPSELTLDAVFPTDRVLDVQLTVAEEDWDTLRNQTRTIWSALSGTRKHKPSPTPFTYVEASVTIDGVKFPRVGIRKKGFIGSLSRARPSLKIKLNHVNPAVEIEGLTNLTLNNNKQDEGLVSQFMGNALFNAAGSPAPRCAYANVTVNGKKLGIYSHVESMRKPLLKRGFGNDEGPLYEGTVVDFYEGWENSLDLKTGDDEAGRGKIQELIDTLSGKSGTVILGPDSEGCAMVPTDDTHKTTWTAVDFDDSGWVKGYGGAGYETDSGYESLFSAEFDFKESLHDRRGSVYMRFPFKLDDPGKVSELTLRMKYDDGFVAYLNGHRVASANGPEETKWDSLATVLNDDQAAVTFQPFNISRHVDKLQKGVNVLAIHGLNVEPSSSDMLIVAELRSSDTATKQTLASLVDLDSFYRFWAIEGLLGFWDGYSGNKNNFMIYLNPKTGKFHFLPWGADSMFVKYSKIDPDRDVPLSVKTGGLIANRLYETPSARARYLKTLTKILDKHWNEEKLLAEADRIETLLQPYAKDSLKQRRFSRELDKVREFIRNRRKEIAEETADGMPVWTKAPSAPAIIPARRAAFGQAAQDADTLWSAARNGDVEAIEKHLETVPVNARDPLGATALSWAAGLGRVDAVALLIEKGADVNARNRDGNTPLDGTETPINDEAIDFLANMFNMEIDKDEILAARPKIAKLLRKHGALNSAELADKPADIWSAARQGKVEAIGEFLKTGVDIDAKDLLGSTALSWAAALGRIDAVKFLLEKGADIDERNSEGKTPLEGTAKEIDEDAADFLFRFFKVEIDPEKVNAAKPKIAEILRKHGEKK